MKTRLVILTAVLTWGTFVNACLAQSPSQPSSQPSQEIKPAAKEAQGIEKAQAEKSQKVQADQSTVGMTAPQGAVVLFDGTSFDAWKPFSWTWINPKDNQKEIQWKLVDDAMEIALEFEGRRRQQTLCTKQKFGDYRLHLEFMLPEGSSGNSGLFFGPLYELQIINSSKKKTLGLRDCGAIYQVRLPDKNVALGPGVWQTVDLIYQHAEVKNYGYMTEKGAARVTAQLNGALIHDNTKLSLRRNKYAAYPEESTSRIVLQDHGSPVKFRNIWIQETPDSIKDSLLKLFRAKAKPADK